MSRLSMPFVLDEVANGVGGLKALDALLVMAINQANIGPLTRQPEARLRYGALKAPAPDDERRPVSINAIAASLGLPFETVRRHIRQLAEERVCVLAGEGVIVPASFLTLPVYLQSVVQGHARLRTFHLELAGAGLLPDLPTSAYPAAGEVPVRAAARLLSDYLLRTAASLMREAGDVVSSLVLLGLLATAVRSPDGASPDAISARALSERLHMPAETVRRHALQLVEHGYCERARGGLRLPVAALASPGLQLLFREDEANVKRLMTGLAERGVIAAWSQQA